MSFSDRAATVKLAPGEHTEGSASAFQRAATVREWPAPRQPKCRSTTTFFVLLVLLLATTSTPTPADPLAPQPAATSPSDAPSTISQAVLDQLDSDDWATREQATRLLLQDDSLTPNAVAQAYQSAKSAEQRHRLTIIAQHHYLRVNAAIMAKTLSLLDSNAGVLGVAIISATAQEIPDVGLHAIRVVNTFPGLPGFAQLEPGDLIIAVNGQTFDLATPPQLLVPNFQALVQAHPAGTTLPLTISRDGTRSTVNIKLASKAVLQLITADPAAAQPSNALLRQCKTFINIMTGKADQPALTDAPEQHTLPEQD